MLIAALHNTLVFTLVIHLAQHFSIVNSVCNEVGAFTCNDGGCVPQKWRCNDINECEDGSDEENCETCMDTQIRCVIDRGGKTGCIGKHSICDGNINCFFRVDENNCPECGKWAFTCGDGECVPLHQRCDGNTNCLDNSDEQNCDDECVPGMFRCPDVKGNLIPYYFVCDGDKDCEEKGDEANCTNFPSLNILNCTLGLTCGETSLTEQCPLQQTACTSFRVSSLKITVDSAANVTATLLDANDHQIESTTHTTQSSEELDFRFGTSVGWSLLLVIETTGNHEISSFNPCYSNDSDTCMFTVCKL